MATEYTISGKLQNCYSCKNDASYVEQLQGILCKAREECIRTEDGGLSQWKKKGTVYKNGDTPYTVTVSPHNRGII